MTIILALLLHAHAGVRIIHGGGGSAEMMALSVHARLPQILRAYTAKTFRFDPRPIAFGSEDPARYLIVPGASLYDRRGAPLPPFRIAELVFWAATDGTSADSARIFGHAMDLTAVNLADGRLHALSINQEVVLLLEKDATVDLTPEVLPQLGCSPSFTPRLTKIEGLHVDNAIVHARATWRCGDLKFDGRLILDTKTRRLKTLAVRYGRCFEHI